MALTDKQKVFCDEYLIDLNATQAAIRAGYSKKTAKEIGAQNLTKLNIQKEIERLMDERSKRTEITQDNVLKEYAKIGFADIKDYLEFKTEKVMIYDQATKEKYPDYTHTVNIKDSSEVDGTLISEVSISKDGTFKFKLQDKMNALEKLGKHLNMFTDNVKFSGDFKVNINIKSAKDGT